MKRRRAGGEAAVAEGGDEYQGQGPDGGQGQDEVQQEPQRQQTVLRHKPRVAQGRPLAGRQPDRAAAAAAEVVRGPEVQAGKRVLNAFREVHALREQHTAQWRARVKLFGGEPAVVLYDLVRQHEGLFARPPVGPLGAHMELEDAGWFKAFGAAVGIPLLKSYLVSSGKDQVLLQQLAVEAGLPGLTVHVASLDAPLRVVSPKALPLHGHACLLDVVHVPDARVLGPILNLLMDRCGIHRILLISTRAMANAFMYQYNGDSFAGKHITTAVDRNGRMYRNHADVKYSTLSRTNWEPAVTQEPLPSAVLALEGRLWEAEQRLQGLMAEAEAAQQRARAQQQQGQQGQGQPGRACAAGDAR